MFDKLKLLYMLSSIYVQMGLENIRTSVHQYMYPVSIEQSWDVIEKRQEHYQSLNLSFEQASFEQSFIECLNDAKQEDIQEAKAFLLQDYNLFGNILARNLELLPSFTVFEKISLDRKQLEQTVYLLPSVVKSYEAQRLVLLIVLAMTTLSPEDTQILSDMYSSLFNSIDSHYIFYNFKRDNLIDDIG